MTNKCKFTWGDRVTCKGRKGVFVVEGWLLRKPNRVALKTPKGPLWVNEPQLAKAR